MFDLYIGNKNYSSWSLRPWLLMKHFGIPFAEHMVSVAGRDYNAALKPLAGNARVPCLHEDGFQVWESIAIAETLAERYPQMWPADSKARARARSISAEMHAGFARLRTAMPMNLKFRLKGKPAQLIARALKLDPQNPHALFLAGAAAMEAGDNKKGIAYWEALLPQVEPGSEIDQMLRSGIDKMKAGG